MAGRTGLDLSTIIHSFAQVAFVPPSDFALNDSEQVRAWLYRDEGNGAIRFQK
jgi:hypothetical protein